MEGPTASGTFDRVTDAIRVLMRAALEGAEAEGLRVAYGALRDQWSAAERDSRGDDLGSLRRFEDTAATLCGEAFWPAILAVSERRDPAIELDRAIEATTWILRAHGAFLEGHQGALKICLRRAAHVVRDGAAEDPTPE